MQIATALILYTGANTPFTGFPFLASFVAEDSFLPRQLTRRGHRLAFSNGIIVLTVQRWRCCSASARTSTSWFRSTRSACSPASRWPASGWRKYHSRHAARPAGDARLAINFAGGIVSLLVVLIFAVVKFTEGAWLVVMLFPLGWFALMRLNKQYRDEARALDLVTARARTGSDTCRGHYARHVVLVMVDRLDLAVTRALRYAGSLRPTDIRAVHVMIDSDVAERLRGRVGRRAAWATGCRWPWSNAQTAGWFARRPSSRSARSSRTGPRSPCCCRAALSADFTAPAARPHRRPDRRGARPDPARRGDDRARSTRRCRPRSSGGSRTQQAAAAEPALPSTRVRTGTDDDEVGVAAHQARGPGITPIGEVAWKQR